MRYRRLDLNLLVALDVLLDDTSELAANAAGLDGALAPELPAGDGLKRPFVASLRIARSSVFTGTERQSHSEARVMNSQEVAPETRGVTVELLSSVDLGPEIDGMAGRQLRMRRVTIEPGGVFGPVHDHVDRPGTVFILQGTITDHRNGIATDYGPGVGWPEDHTTVHWLENRGTQTAVEISVDIVRLG